VTHSGYRNDVRTAHVHRTTDAGATWAAIVAGLPDAAVNVIEIDPIDPATLYLGTDVGVFVSYDLGTSWSPLGSGMPPLVVHDLELHPATETLVAFTHARSSYRMSLPTPTSAPVPDVVDARFELFAHPNPFQDRTTLRFDAAAGDPVEVLICDVSGRVRRTLTAAYRSRAQVGRSAGPGEGWIDFDGRDDEGRLLPAGTYFARVQYAQGRAATARLVRLAR
jgi:hypothetical protein